MELRVYLKWHSQQAAAAVVVSQNNSSKGLEINSSRRLICAILSETQQSCCWN